MLYKVARFTDAVEAATRCISLLPPDDPISLRIRALYCRARSNFQIQNFSAALKDVSECLGLKPAHVEILQLRSIIYRFQGRREKAIQDLARLLQIDHDSDSVHDYLERRTDLRFEQGKAEEALADYEALLTLNPHNSFALRARNACLAYFQTCPHDQ